MITYFSDAFNAQKPYFVKEEVAYQRIKEGNSKKICEELRKETDKKKREKLKTNLPVIVFQGEFSKRSIDGLKKHSGLVVLDFDHLGDRLNSFFERIKSDKYTRAAFVSPSGDGLKVVVRIPAHASTHKLSCKALLDYYKDESLDHFEDVSRACFESYDPNIFVQESEVFETLYNEKEPVRSIKTNNVESDYNHVYTKLQNWLEKTDKYEDGKKHNFIVKLASACNRFGVPLDVAIDSIYSDYHDKASPVSDGDFEKIIKRIYKTYSNQYSTSFFDKKGEAKDNDEKEALEVFSDKVRDVIYLDSIRDRMLSTFRTGETQGETTYFETIDPHWTWKRKELCMHGGIMNAGKSLMESQLCLIKSIKEGLKWAFFSPEQDPPDYFYNDLIHTFIGKPVEPFFKERQCTMDEYMNAMEFIKNHFFYIYPTVDAPTPKYINDRFLEAIEKHGVSGCIIDPFNQLDHDWGKHGRDDRYISEFLTKQKRFASDHNVYMHILAHPNSGLVKKKDGNYDCPDVFDFAGGAMWGNKCDNILVTYRPYYSTDKKDTTTEFRSLKIKKQKLIGIPGTAPLTFDRLSNRYMESVMGVNKNPFGDFKEIRMNRDLSDTSF